CNHPNSKKRGEVVVGDGGGTATVVGVLWSRWCGGCGAIVEMVVMALAVGGDDGGEIKVVRVSAEEWPTAAVAKGGRSGTGKDKEGGASRDQWRRALNEDGKFTVKDLASLVDEIRLQTDRLGEETKWNNLAPKKFNIFVWRVLKGRLPVLNELDKRGIDLNTLLCPCCDDNVETIDHSLLLSNMA
ncbi:RNA-directed DNA polymerase, eukaryota, reverse transcriptase zinc-binding domain protein, partial [Tanacetum coccineum]